MISEKYDYLISVDPGANSAWAAWHLPRLPLHPELEQFGRLKNATAKDIYELFSTFSAVVTNGKILLAVEGQWARYHTMKNGRKQYHSAPFNRVAKIIESRCYYVAVGQMLGMDIDVINPGTWIPAMTKGANGKTPDERIRAVAQLRHPDIKMVKDEHAAVLLGDYVIGRK